MSHSQFHIRRLLPKVAFHLSTFNSLILLTLDLPGNGAGLAVRLLCYQKLDGQTHSAVRKADTPTHSAQGTTTCSPLRSKSKLLSRYLMIHCHGGGFVAQTSKSHEIYLRYWAKVKHFFNLKRSILGKTWENTSFLSHCKTSNGNPDDGLPIFLCFVLLGAEDADSLSGLLSLTRSCIPTSS